MLLDPKLGPDTAVRPGMHVAQRHAASPLVLAMDSRAVDRGDLQRELGLVFLVHFTDFRIDAAILGHVASP